MEKTTLAEKITDIKKQYLKALHAGDKETAKELRSVVLWAEKLGFPPDQCYPLFMEFSFAPNGNYLVKTIWLGVDEDQREGVEMTPAEFDGLRHLKQTVFFEEVKSYYDKLHIDGDDGGHFIKTYLPEEIQNTIKVGSLMIR